MPVPALRLPSWAWVTGLTVGAVAAVAVLAVQADQGPKPTAVATRPSAQATASPSARPNPAPTAVKVPDGSGTGRRIVYSLGQKRVWLIDASDAPRRTFAVWPGTVSPDPGTYTVSVRRDATTGSDGVPIEHIVYFTAKSGLSIAFSNAVDGASPPAPASGTRTGGIRMGKPDGTALWAFATTGTTVTVVG
ncbi:MULTISPECIES: hypothetical protein [Streptomyces]|uniref:L,D-transpeptidase n=2 Tax=Streptomyces TaxID=1883 RepID=A0A2U9P3V9_STRAS|nr:MULTISPECIES: hypothetical protein [Streptomyces]AWT43861.1 hypothetical protein DMT42_17105 [Streptomyces actuosus]MBM4821007.1 hypothetical protein [Streptomyces actuosus]GHF78928.1 L,D-transpeptidase [Streptomyces griseosporeus]